MKIEAYTYTQLLVSWKRLYSRISQLANQNQRLKKINIGLMSTIIAREHKIKQQAHTLTCMHESRRLTNKYTKQT